MRLNLTNLQGGGGGGKFNGVLKIEKFYML